MQSDDNRVAWRTESFPPHWVGTWIGWEFESRDGGCTVGFRHADFGDDDDAGHAAYTWGQILVRLKEFAETGRADPAFA